jgi:L-methionine (R)-S-oxide reductase
MAEELNIAIAADKASRYQTLLPQIEALTSGESDLIANLSNITAALKQTFDFFWVGFYIVRNNAMPVGNQELVLGPFQGPIACTRIGLGKGVCGTSWKEKKTIIVPDVDAFPGHIACSSASKSEIVVPVIRNNEVIMVLDVDSDQLNTFDETDQQFLERLVSKLPIQ